MRKFNLTPAQQDAAQAIYRRSRHERSPQTFFVEAIKQHPEFDGEIWNDEEYFPLQLDCANDYRNKTA